MVKAAPTSALEMRQAEFALDFLVVAFDPPAQFGHVDEREQRGVFANMALALLASILNLAWERMSRHCHVGRV